MATRYEHSGNAVPTKIVGDISATATSITIEDGTGWPTGATGPFWVTLRAGTASEEKALVTSRAGATLTLASTSDRGKDSTTATTHPSGAAIIHSFSATEADDANRVAVEVDAVAGDLVGTSGAQTLTNKTLTAPVVTDITGAARGVLGYAQVTADQAGITTIVDLTGLSVAATVGNGRRIRVSALVNTGSSAAGDHMRICIKEGTTTLQTAERMMASLGPAESVPVSVVLTPTAGVHTYKITLERTVGSGTLTSYAGATRPAFILVEDIGAA